MEAATRFQSLRRALIRAGAGLRHRNLNDFLAAAQSAGGGNLLFGAFVFAVLAFTLIAATHRPDDPLLAPSSHLTSFILSSTTLNATLLPDASLVRTGEDFANSTDTAAATVVADVVPFIELADITTADHPDDADSTSVAESTSCDVAAPVDCAGDGDLFRLLMRSAIERFSDIHFYRFGHPVAAGKDQPMSCDMAWRFRPSDEASAARGRRTTFYKDYRRFTLVRDAATCSLSVAAVGDFHSGANARRSIRRGRGRGRSSRKRPAPDFVPAKVADDSGVVVVGEAVNDSLPVVASELDFVRGRYLVYLGGGERCKSMPHYLWGFLCSLAEARLLNRTLVMDLRLCLSPEYTGSGNAEEGKDFRLYFDFEHLKSLASVIDQSQFWTDWNKWHRRAGLKSHYVDDFRVTPMQLASVTDTLIMRKFGDVEPDNYWSRVCEGDAEGMLRRPWELVWKSRRLMEIVSAIAARLGWDFDAVHVVKPGDSMEAVLAAVSGKVAAGRRVYVATDDGNVRAAFEPLKGRYQVSFLDDFAELWGEGSEWHAETKELNGGEPVAFDGYMRREVDTEVFLRGKKQLQTVNGETKDCNDGTNACATAA